IARRWCGSSVCRWTPPGWRRWSPTGSTASDGSGAPRRRIHPAPTAELGLARLRLLDEGAIGVLLRRHGEFVVPPVRLGACLPVGLIDDGKARTAVHRPGDRWPSGRGWALVPGPGCPQTTSEGTAWYSRRATRPGP